MANQLLVFTDLDSTLLDHDDYSFEAARPALTRLEQKNIPVIINTSKTLAEVFQLRKQLQNQHPFITENGAGIYIPEHYFQQKPSGFEKTKFAGENFWAPAQQHGRNHFRELIKQAAEQCGINEGADFATFSSMGNEGIAEATGLSIEDASLANQRSGSEPLQWLNAKIEPGGFVTHLEKSGARVIKGGRFLHVMGINSSKGNAMLKLAGAYARPGNTAPSAATSSLKTVGLGDSPNDIDMLETADYPIVIRKKSGDAMSLENKKVWMTSDDPAPKGWAQCINALLDNLEVT